MSNYYEKQEGKVKICHELMNRGWKVYGYHADESDSMTDYWSPAHWYGIAEKNGYILVVDNNSDSKGEKITKYNPKGNLSFEDKEKITKLENMTQERGCTAGEEENAKTLIEKIKDKITGESSYDVIGMIPAHMANPGKCKWHIEKDGKIYDKGTGIVKYSDIPKSYEFDINKMEYIDRYKEVWTGNYEDGSRIMEERVLPEETRKVINEFKALILRFERIASGFNPMGDGTAETNQKAAEQEVKIGYEKVIETVTKKVIKPVQKDNITINVNDVLSFNYHGHYWIITDKYTSTSGQARVSYELLGSAKRGYQRLTGTTLTGKRYYAVESRLLKELEAGTTKIHTLQEVDEVTEVEKWVKIDKSKKTYNSKPEVKQEEKTEEININSKCHTCKCFKNDCNGMSESYTGCLYYKTEEQQQEQTETKENILNQEITITADIDTRDNSNIWVVKLVNRVSKEDFNKIRYEVIKPLEGYYSSFKGGFIFKYNPTNKLFNNEVQEQETTTEETKTEKQSETENTTAEYIIDKSTEIITALNINGKDIINNEQYKRQLEKCINKDDITAEVLTYLKVNDYNLLADVLELITSMYWQPEIKDGFIYTTHFKSWDIPINEIEEAILALNIPFDIDETHIYFEGITAEQARQAKEISDINGSIFFIDSEISENEYNTITPEEQTEQEETEINNIIDFEEYKNNNEVKQMQEEQTITEQPEDIFSKFENIEINNNSRISANDEEFCKGKENEYKQFIEFSNNYMQYLENNSLKNSMYNSHKLINEMVEERTNKKCWFINNIVDYFKTTYKVTLTSKPIQDKYSIDINYNTIVSEVIEQLGGYNFKDKAEKEIKDEFKHTIKYEKVEIKNKKISIDSFFYAESWDYGRGKQYKVSYNSDDKFHKLFKALSHFLFGTNPHFNNYFDNIYDIITRKENDDVFKIHDITNKITQTLKLYKNGKIDLEFSTSEYARKFAKEYCGYIEKSA
jgi:hypothetical protein